MIESEFVRTIKLVEITVKDKNYYLEIADVREIFVPERIVPIPLAERSIIGVTDIRGELYTIISLEHRLYGNGVSSKLNSDSRFVLLEIKNEYFGILVDSISSMREVPASIFQNRPAIVETEIEWDYIRSVGVLDGHSYIILDLESLIMPLGSEKQIKLISDTSSIPKRYIPEKFKNVKKTEEIIISPKIESGITKIEEYIKLTPIQS
jgi:purine-binding chemotaxis protein CheW